MAQTVGADGPGAVRLSVRFTVNGATVATRTATLKGARQYVKDFSDDLGTRPCGGTVGMTASTSPASGNGTQTATIKVAPCPLTVTGLRVTSLTMPERGRRATAVVAVTTTGTQAVRLTVTFTLAGKPVHTEPVSLSGKTAYSATVSYRYPRLLCGLSWGVSAATVPEGPPAAATRQFSPCVPSL